VASHQDEGQEQRESQDSFDFLAKNHEYKNIRNSCEDTASGRVLSPTGAR
jgi:hypothetical protein